MGACAPMRRLLLVVALCLALPASARAAGSVPLAFPAVDDYVADAVVSGDVAYLGGHFSTVGASSGPLSWHSTADGSVQRVEAGVPPQ